MQRQWSELAQSDLTDIYAWPAAPTVRLNMVFNADGKITGADGTSKSVTSAHDRELVRLIRADAQITIVGASSVRAEGWFMPPHGELTVVSSRAELPPGCPDTSRVRLATFDDLPTVATSANRVLCEGGKALATEMAQRDLLTELCLTFAAGAGDALAVPHWLARNNDWQFISDIADEPHRFTIWRRGNE